MLLHWAREVDALRAAEDDAYVWWGKVKSPNRQTRQKNVEAVAAIGQAIGEDTEAEHETHLYLTDYRSLYVAEVVEIVVGALDVSELPHVPAYYAEQGLTCDFWFRLGDIRRLVVDDTLGVIQELRRLNNVHYNDRPVSLYGGMTDLPLIVTRPDGARFFAEEERDPITGGHLWVDFDAEQGSGVGPVMRSLRDDRFGEAAWTALEPAARTFIATAERLYRENREDPAFDFAPVMNAFGKAIEVQVNAILRAVLPRLRPNERLANVNGHTVDLSTTRALMLGELARAIGGERALNGALAQKLEHGGWFSSQLPPILDAFREVRNEGTHVVRIDRKTATRWRNQLIGVGSAGVFLELATVRIRTA